MFLVEGLGFRRSHSHTAGKAPHSPAYLHYYTRADQGSLSRFKHKQSNPKAIRKQSSDPQSACVGHCLCFKTHLTSSSFIHVSCSGCSNRPNEFSLNVSVRRLQQSVQNMHQSQRVTILCSSMQSSAPACSLGSPMQRLQAKHACGPIPMQSNSHAAQSSRV